MPFSHSVHPMAREAYLRHIGEILEDGKTIVFLDTNILAYLYKLLGAARSEFFTWTDKLIASNRLQIPAWALHEYLAKLTAGKLDDYTARSKEPDEIRKKLENLQDIASLFVDAAVLTKIGFSGDRNDFLNKFDLATKNLTQITRVFAHEFDAATIHQEIATKLSPAVLASNIAELSIRAGREGEMRYSQRMPPGFRDGSKAENKYGDLIIWFEILQYANDHKGDFDKIVFLSNDEKPDWVYKPARRTEVIGGKPRVVPNSEPAIKLSEPRLIAEFHSIVGHREFHIVSLPVFIEGLSKVRSSGLENLASAIQVDVAKTVSEQSGGAESGAAVAEVGNLNDDVIAGQFSQEPPEVAGIASADAPTQIENALDAGDQPAVPPASVLVDLEPQYAPDALRDGAYEIDESSELDVVIRDLSSHNWYTQNPAITRLRSLREGEFSEAAWFVLGRNIYQAACGNAQKALEFVRDLDIQLSRFPDGVAVHILSGALFEIYFDSTGVFRSAPKSGQIDPVFKVTLKEQYQGAKNFICKQLEPHVNQLVVLPGDATPCELSIEVVQAMVAEVEAVGLVLNSVVFAGHPLLADFPEELEEIKSLWGRHEKRWTQSSIESEICEKWVVPSWQIRTTIQPIHSSNTIFFVPDGKILRTGNLLRAT